MFAATSGSEKCIDSQKGGRPIALRAANLGIRQVFDGMSNVAHAVLTDVRSVFTPVRLLVVLQTFGFAFEGHSRSLRSATGRLKLIGGQFGIEEKNRLSVSTNGLVVFTQKGFAFKANY
jgi:hypothetical protein